MSRIVDSLDGLGFPEALRWRDGRCGSATCSAVACCAGFRAARRPSCSTWRAGVPRCRAASAGCPGATSWWSTVSVGACCGWRRGVPCRCTPTSPTSSRIPPTTCSSTPTAPPGSADTDSTPRRSRRAPPASRASRPTDRSRCRGRNSSSPTAVHGGRTARSSSPRPSPTASRCSTRRATPCGAPGRCPPGAARTGSRSTATTCWWRRRSADRSCGSGPPTPASSSPPRTDRRRPRGRPGRLLRRRARPGDGTPRGRRRECR